MSNDEVIRQVSTNFVPVAVNLAKIRTSPDTKEFFRSVQRQKDAYQGLWIVSPDGKALAGEHDFDRTGLSGAEINKKFDRATLDMLDEGLKAFGPVQPRHVKPEEQLPYRGVGVRPDGSVDLAIYRRLLHQGQSDGPALRDTLALQKQEWAALAPPKLIAGTEWVIPDAVAKKMVRPLSLNTLGDPGAMPGPEDAKVARLTAKVESVQDGRAWIRLTGEFEAIKIFKEEPQLSYRGAATAAGVAVYDVKQKTMSSLLLVFQGTYGRPDTEEGSRSAGAVIEWQAQRPASDGTERIDRPSPKGTSSLGLEVTETGDSPGRKVVIVAPGAYKAVVWQEAGGGIMEFYDLGQDPEAKWNLAGWDRGLCEIGWHGATFQSPADKKDCCLKHILEKNREGACYDGTRDWPSIGHKALQAEGDLEIIEQSPVRVRVRAKSWFVWWSKYADRDLPVEAVYTFYPAGQIVVQVRVKRTGSSPMHWSREYGPHLFVAAPKNSPQTNPTFTFSTPEIAQLKDGVVQPAEELVLTASDKVKTTLLLTIPAESDKLFDCHMRHDGRSVNWDRAGYGSNSIVMEPGYDSSWACLIQIGTSRSPLLPEMRTPRDALSYARQYRAPAQIEGAELLKDDPGDFNKDGYNESEGCHVLKGPGPLAFSYERGTGAGHAAAFKIVNWKSVAPQKITVDGKEIPAVSAVLEGHLLVQLLGTLPGAKAKVEIER